MCADPVILGLEETGRKTIIIFCSGEHIPNDLNKEAIEGMIKNAVLYPVEIKNCVREINDKKETESTHSMIPPAMIMISEVLCNLGIPANLLGYEYLRFAIQVALTDRESLYGITKILYPAVAKEFNTSSSRVERAIRHAIEVACNRGNTEVFRRVFGNTVSPNTGKPTNSEFISKIADRLSMDESFFGTIPNYA